MGRNNSQACNNYRYIDIGDVDRVGSEFIVVREGVANCTFVLYSQEIYYKI